MVCLIDLGRPVMFVHLPKTGGTSIRWGRQLTRSRWFEPDPDWPACPSFTVVRDPFARMVSCWKDFRFGTRKDALRTNLDFGPFVDRILCSSWQSQILPETSAHHGTPMTHPVHGVKYAADRLHTETLQADLTAWCAAHDLEAPTLGWERSTAAFPDPVWTDELRAAVQLWARDDFPLLTRHEPVV